MKVTQWIVFVLIFIFIESDDSDKSLSFSASTNQSNFLTTSFWSGTIPSRLFDNELRFKVYLNEPQGLLFYGIDNTYQTLWLQFDMTKLNCSYYNFKSESVEHTILDLKELYNQQEIKYTVMNIKVYLLAQKLIIGCNLNEWNIYYSPNIENLSEKSMKKFQTDMTLPVPAFESTNSTNNKTYIWLGNTPPNNIDNFTNVRMESQRKLFLGCLFLFSIGNNNISLPSTGGRYGNMIEPFCRPVCNANSCQNKGRCIELWRERFICQCGVSRFMGPLCNDSFGVNFDGAVPVNITIRRKMQKFQLVFKRRMTNENSMKLFSIAFVFNQSISLYIDNRRSLRVKLTTDTSENIELSFGNRIYNNLPYIIIIESDINGLTFNLINTIYINNNVKKTISRNFPNLVTESITVGDSHVQSMAWMRRFEGCISNLILKTAKREFVWNTIPNFNSLPSCNRKRFSTVKYTTQNTLNLMTSSFSSSSHTKIVSIVVPVLVLIVIAAIVLVVYFVCKSKKLDKSAGATKKLSKSKGISREYKPNKTSIGTFKPAYKAESLAIPEEKGILLTSISSANPPLVENEEIPDC